ncbi:MAG: 5'/3'-nucleotidase SurE [Rikenellaceae bacterium]|jgi:5'-nucleotidase|nr:5'/3'-nucleotidase SurE [Rikenellaceae bacterium]
MQMKKPLIFVTNDDGVGARGFQYALSIARKFGEVVAVAPERTQSGMSHAITMSSPLHLRRVRQEEGMVVYACDGTPVDCVKMAFDYLLADRRPDLSISGINHGSNSSVCVIYSGTMGAAVEASFYNIPSVGLSLLDHNFDADCTAAAHFGEIVVRSLLHAERLPSPLCLNVNIPMLPLEQLRGVKVCRQAKAYFRENFHPRLDPSGREYFWLTGDMINLEPTATDTDEWALDHGYVSVVPVQVDLTAHRQIDSLKKLF